MRCRNDVERRCTPLAFVVRAASTKMRVSTHLEHPHNRLPSLPGIQPRASSDRNVLGTGCGTKELLYRVEACRSRYYNSASFSGSSSVLLNTPGTHARARFASTKTFAGATSCVVTASI
jgi:hypothetical protein